MLAQIDVGKRVWTASLWMRPDQLSDPEPERTWMRRQLSNALQFQASRGGGTFYLFVPAEVMEG